MSEWNPRQNHRNAMGEIRKIRKLADNVENMLSRIDEDGFGIWTMRELDDEVRRLGYAVTDLRRIMSDADDNINRH